MIIILKSYSYTGYQLVKSIRGGHVTYFLAEKMFFSWDKHVSEFLKHM
jgi:hypothetical protein